MKTIRYRAIVDSDVKYPLKKFEEELSVYLADPDGWASRGYVFLHDRQRPEITISLSSPATIHKLGCQDPQLSCAMLGGDSMHINAHRWTGGPVVRQNRSLDDYRQYVVSHEMGHVLGFDHVSCPGKGHAAPIMMQQTLGLGECSPNTKLTAIDTRSKKR
jgi:hypothetical protein